MRATVEREVLYDALREGRANGVADLVAEIVAVEGDQHSKVLHDGCGGDADGWKKELEQPHVLLRQKCHDEGYGHHGYDEVVVFADGRVAHANCGGCSCEGNGDWAYCSSLEEAIRLIPEQVRDEDFSAENDW